MIKLKIFLLLILSLLSSQFVLAAENSVLVLDAANSLGLPKHYRNTDDQKRLPASISNKGLNTLHALGSAQFSEKELATVIRQKPKLLTVVDLRQESHGFLNGNAISWYAKRDWGNLGKTSQQVEQDQTVRLNSIASQKTVVIDKIVKKEKDGAIQVTPLILPVNQVMSEEKLAHNYHLNYKRFYITDGMRPSDQEVDRFVRFERNLSTNAVVYFHCRGGKGRTTTFMVLHDMMRTAKQVSLNDIISREELIGGINLFKLPSKTSYKYEYALQRIQFLKRFYQYSSENKDNFKTGWSQWVSQRK